MITIETARLLLGFCFGLSAGFWLLYGLYAALRVQWFIVNRYEQETNLLDTIAFKEHATFSRALPYFFSSAVYTSHLSLCLWGWRLCEGKKAFRDIDDPSLIAAHFSQKEIRRVKKLLLSTLIVIIHVIALYIFRFIWPETFG
jgi:hypothetical protein